MKSSEEQSEVLDLDVGGVRTEMVIDSGSLANIVDSNTFEQLKQQNAHILNERDPEQDGIRYAAFASNVNIFFSKVFETVVKIPGEETGVWSHVLVAPSGQVNLLSKGIAFALGVLKIGYYVNQISRKSRLELTDVLKEFPKVPGVYLNIQVDETVHPVVQSVRRFPVSMEADVEKIIQDLLEKKIIERAESPLTWVCPLVLIRKTDGKIRLCVDMRAANKAVKREN